jgi:predicted nucleotide-binding protein (sugar kinase/HSP70/actin superfamily)
MKITFPHMGDAYISVKVLLDELGLDYYMPPVGSHETMEIGIANSPEFMCLPFKKVLGDFINGLNNGADTILFGESGGQCRMSYYGDLMQEILRSMGYKFNYIHFNLSHITYKEAARNLGPFFTGKSKLSVIKAAVNAGWTVFAVDKLYALSRKIRCREIKHGTTDKIMREFEQKAQTVHGFKNIHRALTEARKELKHVEIDKTFEPVKIALVGEIFISSDSFTNLEIEKKLGNMGAYVHNTMGVSEWILKHFVKYMIPFNRRDKSIEAAQPYMHTDDIGGHGIYTIGNTELLSHGSYDGIIQIYPFTCMPEIIAQTTLGEIQRKNGVPVMTLILDEMTGETGYITRLEAFVDMLRFQKEQKYEGENQKESIKRPKLKHVS